MLNLIFLLCLLPIFGLFVVMPLWKYRAHLREKRERRWEMAKKISWVQNTIAPTIKTPAMPPIGVFTGNFSKDDDPVIIDFKGGATKKPPSVFDLDLTVYRPSPNNNKLPRNSFRHEKDDHQQLLIGETYSIIYRDADGDCTDRDITIKRVWRENYTTYIKAYCHLRHDERTFSLDRIQGYLIDTSTGEAIDPEELNPLKRKTVITEEDNRDALHLQISDTADGWVVHHPSESVSRREDRKKREVTPYKRKIDAYRVAFRLAGECDENMLCLYQHGNYRPKPPPDNADGIRVVYIDLQTPEGRLKMKRLQSL
jgi:WYL domain